MGKRTKETQKHVDQLDNIPPTYDQSSLSDEHSRDQEEISKADDSQSDQWSPDGGSSLSEVLSSDTSQHQGNTTPVIEEPTIAYPDVREKRMNNVSFVMITVDRKFARKSPQAKNYIDGSIKSLIDQGFPTDRKLYVYDDGSPQEYGEFVKSIHPIVEFHHFDEWGADINREKPGWNRNSIHTFRSLEHHIKYHEQTEWICIIEDDIEMVKKGFYGFELAMSRCPNQAWTLSCYTPNIKNGPNKIQPNQVWMMNPAHNYPNNVFSLVKPELIQRMIDEKEGDQWRHFGAADLAIQSFMIKNRLEPNFALRRNICQHIGDFSSVGDRPVRRANAISLESNLLVFIEGILGMPRPH